jgi:Rrf2 family protein
MIVSTKGRYALRMLLDLAQQPKGEYVALKDIAARQGISKKYLEQIIPLLGKSGILSTNRGAQGGYRLARSPENCTVGEILRLTEGDFAPVACLEDEQNSCENSENCLTLPVWKGLQQVIDSYVDSITLQDILDKNRTNAGDDYII